MSFNSNCIRSSLSHTLTHSLTHSLSLSPALRTIHIHICDVLYNPQLQVGFSVGSDHRGKNETTYRAKYGAGPSYAALWFDGAGSGQHEPMYKVSDSMRKHSCELSALGKARVICAESRSQERRKRENHRERERERERTERQRGGDTKKKRKEGCSQGVPCQSSSSTPKQGTSQK